MANISFTVVPDGYSPAEVDRYIQMLQQEYTQAIAWGEEMEQQLEELKTQMEEHGVYFTLDADNQNEVIANVFAELTKTVSRIRNEAAEEAKEILDNANERSKAIVKNAMEKSVELRSQNDAVMKNLKSISDMIGIIIDKSAK